VSDIVTSHTFTREGTYLVSLTVTDNGGLTNDLTKAIFVGKISPPVASFTARYLIEEPPHTMSFDASESHKPGGNITTYRWDFGDNSAAAAGRTITHQYLNTGTYRVNLTVVDNAGLTNSVIRSVDVQPAINVTLVAAAGLVIAVVAGILIFLWWNPKLQIIPQQAAVPANGTSVIPLRVQFINAFKKEKKRGKDTEVKLGTTSGTLQDVTVLKGQSHADARLTSSLECGSVTVTGESDGKKAECTVEFSCKDSSLELTLKPADIPADGKSVAQISIRAKDPSGKYLTFLKDRTVEITSTAGTIAGPVVIPAKAPGANTTITSEKKHGEVTIKASSPPLKGEVKITFVELEKRFCMHCGTQMELEEKSCPKCGKIPPSGVDVKQCPACNTVIPASATYCSRCGSRQAGIGETGTEEEPGKGEETEKGKVTEKGKLTEKGKG
jgi:PKD repeat protein